MALESEDAALKLQAMELAERFSNPDFLARIDRLLKALEDLS